VPVTTKLSPRSGLAPIRDPLLAEPGRLPDPGYRRRLVAGLLGFRLRSDGLACSALAELVSAGVRACW
jgi:hypothetical protein